NKGTEELISLWQKHPNWPLLTIVQHPNKAEVDASTHNIRHVLRYLDDAELKLMQNQHLFHLCVSDTEGFGHYLMEAMSMQAVVIATDAPPMNELVTEYRGLLVGYDRTSTQNLATCYHVDEVQLQATIEKALSMTPLQTDALGFAARKFFLSNDTEFRERIYLLMEDIAGEAQKRKTH
ncbi:MAG: glycosyltransferase, partial [Arenimonas sp.]